MKSVQYIGQTDISSSGVIFEEKICFFIIQINLVISKCHIIIFTKIYEKENVEQGKNHTLMINNLPEVIEVLNRHFNRVFIFLYILTLSKSLKFAFVSKLLKVCPLISFGITKHFQDFDNSIKVFTEFSILPLISDMEQHVPRKLFIQAWIFICPLGKLYTKP